MPCDISQAHAVVTQEPWPSGAGCSLQAAPQAEAQPLGLVLCCHHHPM